MIKNLTLGIATAAIALSPTLAAAAPANPASSLSVSRSVRAATPSAKKSQLAGPGLIVAVIAAGIVAGGIILAVDDDDDNSDSN